jgi:hypothetical protein
MTLVMVVHISTIMIFSEHNGANVTHPLLDPTDISAFMIHSLAYSIACVATTVFLLICAAIILGITTILMELLAEAFQFLRSIRTVRPLQRSHTEPNDTESDSWNYR